MVFRFPVCAYAMRTMKKFRARSSSSWLSLAPVDQIVAYGSQVDVQTCCGHADCPVELLSYQGSVSLLLIMIPARPQLPACMALLWSHCRQSGMVFYSARQQYLRARLWYWELCWMSVPAAQARIGWMSSFQQIPMYPGVRT